MTSKIKSPALVIVLSIVTCGIYGWIFIYQTTNDIKEFTGDESCNPALELILSIVTCGIYLIYWCYKYSKKIFEMQNRTGVESPNDISVLALILPIFGLSIVSYAVMQSELNKVWAKVG